MPAHLSLAAAVWLLGIAVLSLRVEFAHQRFRAYWYALGPLGSSRAPTQAAPDLPNLRGLFLPAPDVVRAMWRVQEDPYLESARRRVLRRWCELLAVGLLMPLLVLLPAPVRDWLVTEPRA